MDGGQPTTSQVGGAKKNSLEGLSKEELIKKCKGLLVLAQKAKQSKDEFAEENKTLKEDLNKFETQKDADKKSLMAMKEMVDALTDNKLSQTIQIADLEMKLSKCQKEIDRLAAKCKGVEGMSIENESLKRQVQRLGDENEELLSNLDSMEKKLEQVNQFGMQQQKDLILLEEATATWKSLEIEWKQKLDEMEKENIELKDIIEAERSKQHVSKIEAEKSDTTLKLEAEIKLLQQGNETLRKSIEDSSKDYENLLKKCKTYEEMNAKQAEELDIFRKTSDLQNARLQHIKIKLAEVTMKLKKLKKAKLVLADAVQEYYEAIPKWQQEVQKASEQLCIHINTLDKAKKSLEVKVNVLERNLQSLRGNNVFYKKRLEELVDCCDKVISEERNKNTKLVQLADASTGTEEQYEHGKAQDLQELLQNSLEELKICSESLKTMTVSRDSLQDQLKLVANDKTFYEVRLLELIECCHEVLSEGKDEDFNLKLKELNESLLKAKEDFERSQKHLSTIQEDFNKQSIMLENAEKELETLRCEKSGRIRIESNVEELQLKLCAVERDLITNTEQNEFLQSKLALKESEHADLLVEMRELNDAKKKLEVKVNFLEEKLQSLKGNNVFYKKRLTELVDCCDKVISEDSNKNTKLVEVEDACTGTDEQCEDGKEQHLKELLKKSSEELKICSESLEAMTVHRDSLQDQIKLVTNDKTFYEVRLLEFTECCHKVLSESKDEDFNLKLKDLNESLLKTKEDYERSQKHLSTMQEDYNKQSIMLENAEKELETLRCEKSGRMRIESNIEELQLKFCAAEKDLMTHTQQNELLQSKLALKESEHADLLAEMRELNEALKGRGDVISRQQDKISELEKELVVVREKLLKVEMYVTGRDEVIAQKETEITKMSNEVSEAKGQVVILSNQARESEQIIKNLSDEMTAIRDRVTDMQSDVLSTSTISRAEESSRMREVDESFEEKYNKLRSLAIKLKKKVHEQANQIAILENDNRRNFEEKNEIRTKLGSINLQVKNLQALQNENDKLQDEIEKMKKEKSNAERQIKDLADKIQTLSDAGVCSKQKTENVVQEYQNQIKLLKQEKDSFNLVRKDWEKERENLKGDIASKEREVASLRQEIEKNKTELERCKAAGKQSSVLTLEIEAYEKSLNDATQNLKTKEAVIKDLRESIKSKDESLESIKKEIKLLEESLESERTHSSELKQQMDIQQTKLKESEHEKSKLRERVQDLTAESESLKSQVDELRLQMSELVSEKDKLIKTFQKEKEALYRQVVSLEENVANLTAKLKTTECEMEDVKTEYANYKVRAQSILRQNQTKETSRERELEEEITAMRSTVESLNLDFTTAKEATAASERKIEEFRQDNERIQKRCKELMQLLEESRLQNEAVLEDNRKQSRDYQESLKAHRLQIDAINSCYKKQVEEIEKKHATELEELKKAGSNAAKESRLVSRVAPFGGPKTSDEQKIDLILMEREDAEGSEMSVQLPKRRVSSTRSKHDMIPLDELLNTSFEDHLREDDRPESPTLELQVAREKLQMQESRVRHLTSLLSETEQDLARLTQLNEVLKEEVRRHERAVEREQHIQNSEYLKNVVLKFLTLASGDERSRLVPVLNTILKLSPEETQTLQNVAKGTDIIQRGWGSYLPIWSNHQ